MTSNEILTPTKGKGVPITITRSAQESIQSFKKRLEEMKINDEVNDKQKRIIEYILTELDPYESNFLIAYYDLAQCSPTRLGKLLGIDSSLVSSKLKTITKKCKLSTLS